MGAPQNRWVIGKNRFNIDDLRVPSFWEIAIIHLQWSLVCLNLVRSSVYLGVAVIDMFEYDKRLQS